MQRITQLELGLMFILFHFSTAAGFLLGLIFSTTAYQGWLVIIIATAGGLLITYISIVLARQRPDEYFVHYGKELVGRWLHIIMMIGYSFFFIHLASMVLREITDFLVEIYLPTTPAWMVASLFGFVIAVAVRSGVETIFRCASGFFFIIFSTAAAIPFLVGKELNYNRAIALLTHLDMGNLWSRTFPFIPWFGELFLLLFIFPFVANPEKTIRTLMVSSLVSVSLIEVNFILCFLLFGAHLAGNLTYPVLEMIRFIRIGDFLENLDPLVVAIWSSSLFIKISLLLYISVLIVSQLFGLKDSRPFSFSFGAIMVGLSIHMVKNSIELDYFLVHSWAKFALFVQCSPLIYLVMFIVKKRRQKTKYS